MADQPDQESKTEEASEKKIQDAIDKGNVPVSREAVVVSSLVGILVMFGLVMPDAVAGLAKVFSRLIENPSDISLATGNDGGLLLYALTTEVSLLLAPGIAILAGFGLLAALLQNTPSIVFERIKPKASRLSIKEGVKRIIGKRGLMEFCKATFKFLLVGCVVMVVFHYHGGLVSTAVFLPLPKVPGAILTTLSQMLGVACIATALLAVADLIWTRRDWLNNLKMTRQEVKDEHKDIDGDPLIKARVRAVFSERARRRMIADVPTATLVIANPTHLAIAMKYVGGEMAAPVVVAKGRNLIAEKIKEVARAHSIPVIEDKPLTRSMYDTVEVGQSIPPEFYELVAKLIVYLNQKPGRLNATHM